MRGRPLTDRQATFLSLYYKHDFDVKAVKREMELDSGALPDLIRTLKKEMVEMLELKLVEQAGSAIGAINEILISDKPVPNISTKLQAAQTVLDRIGIVKKEKLEVEHTGQVGLFVLPPKSDVVIEGDIEDATYSEA